MTYRIRYGWKAIPWRHWQLALVLKLLSSFVLSTCFLLYSAAHSGMALGFLSYALGVISLLALDFYAILYVLKTIRRKQRLQKGITKNAGKILNYEEFKQKHGVN